MSVFLFFLVVGVVGTAAWKGVGKVSRWLDRRAEEKLLSGAMMAEIEDDAQRRRPTQAEIWAAEREIDQDLEDLVN